MGTFAYNNETYEVDNNDFLADFHSWDKNFAEGLALKLGIAGGLTKEHWDVLNYIREAFRDTGRCPLVYETCRANGLSRRNLKVLFPTGYLRGACKLAGITYREGFLGQSYLPSVAEDLNVISTSKTYAVDVRGFLINAGDWDEIWAAHRAYDMKINDGKLTDKHWQVIKFLRQYYDSSGKVPTVHETCENLKFELDELEKLFPDGYHRGAVKIAGLKAR